MVCGCPENDGLRDGPVVDPPEDPVTKAKREKAKKVRPSIKALLSEPTSLLVLDDGSVLFTDKHSIRQVSVPSSSREEEIIAVSRSLRTSKM